MPEDKTLRCKECGEHFTFTVGEQEFYAQKGFQNEPTRCAPCRRARKRERATTSGAHFREGQTSRSTPFRPDYKRF